MTRTSTTGTPFFPAAPARRLLARVVADHDGNLTAASAMLQVDRRTLGRHPSELWPEWFADEQVSR